MTSAQIVRNHVKSLRDDPETQRVAAVEFAKAFTFNGTYREVYYVVLTHEYSQETTFEVIRVIIDDHKTIVDHERVFMS